MILSVRCGESELAVKKSRFIAVASPASSRDEVKALVARLKKEHREARHVCYGYIADDGGLDFGYDDDGEPNGTAGRPIYQAIDTMGARHAAVAVVRYFGGIKLGVGGLTRAYRDAAADVIAKTLVKVELRRVYEAVASGANYKKISPVLRSMGCAADNIVYGENVCFTVSASAELDIEGALGALGASVKHVCDRYTEVT